MTTDALAEIADRAALWWPRERSYEDVREVGRELLHLELDEWAREGLARSCRRAIEGTDGWIAVTAKILASPGKADTGEVTSRLVAISWAWGPVPRRELDELRRADEAALARG